MFKESKKKLSTPATTDTLLANGTSFEGTIEAEANIRIDGHFQGDIYSTRTVVIGESAVVRSDIIARDVILAGKVFGSITTEGRLTITSTGELYGNTATPTLVISEGGVLNGTSQMNQTMDAESPAAIDKSEDENQSSFSQDIEDSQASLQPEAG
ncbi:polymer-forming cytoskeletal protein [Paenibacillus polymyxa]|uniref:bactofilin family protein n=1 Tax=Paenibacillus TaxID=44249 RepID=UPI0005EC93B0|nr:polymer-forming cytoskeletal protein [Paenibacillus polymyxa]KJK31844.1 cell division protein [Paenibacillus polymyxa]MBE3649112.1 polymer-forming cytoskeletal protein [Paenibacillus polymyxa]MEE4577773.1 polymer-forming cytoskeletal protein [Paenibacillus polymyxa]PNQ84575.1 polymer-forming cytoskeletal protein [Paenibacillus polymyxa]RGL34140.1 polymer-forming cytoskeletal protein [Paenibacillus polymyxa]